jgi:acyl carrier protein
MTHDQVVSRIREYVVQNFLYMRQGLEFADSDSLLDRGIVDSVGTIELVTFVQDEFAIPVENGEITETNFGTLESIGWFVLGKRAAHLAA